MKKPTVISFLAASLLMFSGGKTFAVVVAGEDFDDMMATTETFDPDNSTWNGLFGASGSRFDRFGIANVTIDDQLGSEGLPFDVVDESVTNFPGDSKGIISEFKTDNFFVATDINNSSNTGSLAPNARATWTFDVSGYQNLSLSIDMAMLGSFETSDEYRFSYSLDGGQTAEAFSVRINTVDDGTGTMVAANDTYAVTMDDGSVYSAQPNRFFSDDEWSLLNCTLGTPNSCETEVAGDDPDGFEFFRPHFDDTNNDGHVYYDTATAEYVDTPEDPNDVSVGAIRIYEDENGNGTFRTPESLGPWQNPLAVDGDPTKQLTNKLVSRDTTGAVVAGTESTFTTALTGTGSTLTLTLDAIADGGDEFFVFDNIVIEGDAIGGGLVCDFNADGTCDLVDLELLVDNIGSASGVYDLDGVNGVDSNDIDAWLTAASDATNPYLGGTATFVRGDANLDGTVDSADLGLLLNNFGSTVALDWENGNLNGDGVVDSTDLGQMLNQFGFGTPAATSAVPEPTGITMLLGGSLMLAGLARRRRP